MSTRPNNLRGKILEFLKHLYPEGADERSVVSIYYEYHRHADILGSLEYLTDKEYISRKEIPHQYKPGEKIKLYKISPKGIDLLEGLIEDPAILVCPEVD